MAKDVNKLFFTFVRILSSYSRVKFPLDSHHILSDSVDVVVVSNWRIDRLPCQRLPRKLRA